MSSVSPNGASGEERTIHFDLDDTERSLRDAIGDLCAGRVTSERVRGAADTGGVDRDLFRELGEAGVFALRRPEHEGGLGLGMTHATVVFEQLGCSLVPGPLVETHLAAGLVDGAADGRTVVGAPLGDLFPAAADVVVVPREDGLYRVDDPAGEPIDRPLDPVTPLQLATAQDGEPIAGPDDARRWRREATVLRSALLLGIALQTSDDATAYAKQREQFGVAIGAFQAIKHRCADMLTRAEVTRASVYAAAATLDDPEVGDVERAVAGAAILAAEAAVRNAKANIQIHGGMGFTWEVDAHLYLKRAAVLAAAEPAAGHAEVIANRLGAHA
ncbi:MAG: acyl-CoA/acyl-ACP dehydrogenase [Actinobacteria bacterium]|nr:acyl-CoA/acyl-ACP dehydrogenase [Actinomycetota bacterium]